MKSARKPIPRSRAWQRGYNSGTNPCKMPKENPYRDNPTEYSVSHGIVGRENALRWYTSDEFLKICRENGRHRDWNSGFVAGRKHTRRLKKLKAEDAEYDIYANLGEELGY